VLGLGSDASRLSEPVPPRLVHKSVHTNRPDLRVVHYFELRIKRVFSCVARGFKACPIFMFAGCRWCRSLAVDGGSGPSRGHRSVMCRPGSQWDGAVERPSLDQGFRVAPGLSSASHLSSTGPG
jgi:hypothetical protein